MTLELAKPRPIWQIMFSTHHTDIGLLYLITSLAFLFMGGSLALIIRLELFLPGSQFIADSMTFNRIFTVHGTTLIFLFILPFASAVGNYFVPIMIRYKDMAYPKLNAIAFWMNLQQVRSFGLDLQTLLVCNTTILDNQRTRVRW